VVPTPSGVGLMSRTLVVKSTQDLAGSFKWSNTSSTGALIAMLLVSLVIVLISSLRLLITDLTAPRAEPIRTHHQAMPRTRASAAVSSIDLAECSALP